MGAPRDITKFILLATQRSGSTWLMSMLSGHPRIQGLNEIFSVRWFTELQQDPASGELYGGMQPDVYYVDFPSKLPRPFRVLAYMDHIAGAARGYEAVGYKLMYNQLKARPEMLLKLKLDGYRVVHLIRENYLDVIISDEMYRRRRVAHATQELPPEKLDLSPAELLDLLARSKRRIRLARAMLRLWGLPVYELTYDQLCADPVSQLHEVCAFLSLEAPPVVSSAFRKMNRAPHWETLSRYDEIRAALAGTEYEPMLHQPSRLEAPAGR